MLGAYAIADLFTREAIDGLTRYRRFIADEFAEYEAMRREFYGRETRWAGQAFWRRRQGTAPQAPVEKQGAQIG